MAARAVSIPTTEPHPRPSFLAAIDRLAAQIDIEKLRSLLVQGRVEEALNVAERVAKAEA